MRKLIAAGLLILLVSAGAADSVIADPLQEAEAAFGRSDYATVLQLSEPLAVQGNARAEVNLGILNEYGLGIPRDESEAANWYRQAAEQGDAAAQTSLGLMYEHHDFSGTMKEAASWYLRAADQGDALGQFLLGRMYTEGWGVNHDDAMAAALYRKAADQGLPEAQEEMRVAYTLGMGVPKDPAMAILYARKAADQGHALAQAVLAQSYLEGRGMPQDHVLALEWISLAAEHFPASAVKRASPHDYLGASIITARNELAAKMTADENAEAERLVSKWRSRHPVLPEIHSYEMEF